MTESQIEAKAEAMMDALDARYLAGRITEEEYKARVREIDDWANAQYREMQSL